MKRVQNKYILASFTGLVPAILEAILLVSVEPDLNGWILFQSVLFWFTCGFVVFLLNFQSKILLRSLFYTVVICSPWYIAESFSKNQPDHFIPIMIASLVMGLVIGFLIKLLNPAQDLTS